jgi:membrane-associated phospholipid phosphatase
VNKVLELDAAVAEAALPLQDTKTHQALGWLAKFADQPQLRMLCGMTIVVGLLREDRRLAGAGARMLIAHELATTIKTFIKHRIDRRRPRALDNDTEALKPHLGDDHAKEASSFPSGHSAGAAAVARAFARSYPDHRAPAYAAAGVVALVQIPRCAHYPTDVGAGVAIGIVAEETLAKALSR